MNRALVRSTKLNIGQALATSISRLKRPVVETIDSGSRARGRVDASIKPITLAKIPKTGELIARELRRRIVRGELTEGATLPAESDLMAQLSVSRSSLREALRILESEALLTVRRGSRGGPVVHRPDPTLAAKYFGLVLQSNGTSLQDAYHARMLIEPPAVRLVVQNAKRKAPSSLLQIMEDERAAIASQDMALMVHGLALFHDALIELTGNKTLLLIMQMLNGLFEMHVKAVNATVGPEFDQAKNARLGLRAQERLLQFIEAGDSDGAVAYWRTHLGKAMDILFARDNVRDLIDVVE